MYCARLKEVMHLKKKFIEAYGEQTLIDDANLVIKMVELNARKVREYRDRGNSK